MNIIMSQLDRLKLSASIACGLLAAESMEGGWFFADTYLKPDGKESKIPASLDGEGKTVKHELIRTREQCVAEQAVRITDALIAECQKEKSSE